MSSDCGQVGMRKLSLFSGIGGDDLASDWAGIQTVCFVERDPFCQKVLARHWPGIPIIGDVRDVTKEKVAAYAESVRVRWGQYRGQGWQEANGSDPFASDSARIGIDIISAGFPCQPHSVAGKRKGSGDDRDLWPEVRRIVSEFRPRWCVFENVPGLLTSKGATTGRAGDFFRDILRDLSALGYSVGWCTFGAVDVGAWHRRDRIFIVAHSPQRQGDGRGRGELEGKTGEGRSGNPASESSREDVADTTEPRLEGQSRDCALSPGESDRLRVSRCGSFNVCHASIEGLPDWAGGEMGQPSPLTELERPDGTAEEREIERNFRGVAHGISRRVDRLRALGNAVVPQQIYEVYKAIVDAEMGKEANR